MFLYIICACIEPLRIEPEPEPNRTSENLPAAILDYAATQYLNPCKQGMRVITSHVYFSHARILCICILSQHIIEPCDMQPGSVRKQEPSASRRVICLTNHTIVIYQERVE